MAEGSTSSTQGECLIHCSDDNSNLVAPTNIESWKTLLRAAEITAYQPILDLAKDLPEGRIPSILYHRKCRSIFTMKKRLDKINAKETSAEKSVTEDVRRSTREAPTTSRVYEVRCIFCNKCSKYLKGQRTKESLTQCVELRADDKIRRAAAKKGDKRVLAIASRDLVAAEGHYHRSCYRAYTKEDSDIGRDETNLDQAESPYEAAERVALQKVFAYIREKVIESPTVVPFTDLTSTLVTQMSECGVTELKHSTKTNLRRKIEAEFGKSVHIIPNDKGRLLVYPESLKMEQLVKWYQELKDELDVYRRANIDEDSITKAALKIRKDIQKHDIVQSWPPHVTDLERNIICSSLADFFGTVLTGSSSEVQKTQRVKRLSNSFSQDLIYAVTNGKVKPAKHVVLPFAVRSLTGNVELIQILNRLGHSVSYSQVEELDTALCLQKQAVSGDAIPLPQNIKLGRFTTLAWDNIDRLEETTSGKGTSHRVNGIALQRNPTADHTPENIPLPCIPKTKRRSIEATEMTLPIYNAGERVNPPVIHTMDADHAPSLQYATTRNYTWVMARLSNEDVCSWTGFNILSRNNTIVEQDSIGYLPTINAPATQLSTVHEILQQSIAIMKSLQLNKIVVVFDQALYAKAVEISWKHQERFQDIVIRMGVFHTACTFMATIGKRFADAGLRDLCVEAGVIAEGSISGVIDGRMYNRAVRLHKLLYEALLQLAWKGFRPWLEENHQEDVIHLEASLLAVSDLCEDVCQSGFEGIIKEESLQHTLAHFTEFLSCLRQSYGPLSALWMSYVDMVEILLCLIRASREGKWPLHLAAIRAIIPWCFAYDKQNYARYLTYYYAQMSCLESVHPDVHAHFMEGGFSVQLGKSNPFGRIPVDQTIEETVNKDTQTAGGTKGFSLKAAAVTRYYLTSENKSQYLRLLRSMVGNESSDFFSHQDLQRPRIQKDRADVNAFVELMEGSWINPFGPDQSDIISLSTGIAVSPDIASDLLHAQQTGEKAYMKFRSERLEKDSPSTKFLDKITKQNLKTFTSMKASVQMKQGQKKDVILKADRNLFGHMIIASQSRNLNIKDVLAHPLGPLPWALSNPDGSLRKTNKAALARELEKSAPSVEDIGENTACIIDGMSLVQRVKGDGKTFGQIANTVLNQALLEGRNSARIDVVFDVYWKTSIKNAERSNRGSGGSTQWKNIAPGHNVVQWRKLLSNADSKTALIKFFVDQWKLEESRAKLQGKQLLTTCGETCYRLSEEVWDVVEELKCSHEEADTRMLLHASHASQNGYQTVLIVSEDTDVMILALACSKMINALLCQKTGTQNRTRYINISALAQCLGEDVCDALIGMHALTGCDSTSAFAGQGKLRALKLVKGSKAFQEAFKSLGTSWALSKELYSNMESFVCRMYAPSSSICDINDVRYMLFCAKRGEVDSSSLPPCRDCLSLHVQRANYQAGIWRQCLEGQPDIPEPKGHGWTTNDEGMLILDWLQGPPAPLAVLELLACKCIRACKLPDCTCLSNKLKCTDLCRLQTCSNQMEEEVVEDNINVVLDVYDDNDD